MGINQLLKPDPSILGEGDLPILQELSSSRRGLTLRELSEKTLGHTPTPTYEGEREEDMEDWSGTVEELLDWLEGNGLVTSDQPRSSTTQLEMTQPYSGIAYTHLQPGRLDNSKEGALDIILGKSHVVDTTREYDEN